MEEREPKGTEKPGGRERPQTVCLCNDEEKEMMCGMKFKLQALAALQERCDEHRQFASLERIHHWLHYWLALHIPFSIALFVFFIAHVLVALRVVPWSLPFRLYQ